MSGGERLFERLPEICRAPVPLIRRKLDYLMYFAML